MSDTNKLLRALIDALGFEIEEKTDINVFYRKEDIDDDGKPKFGALRESTIRNTEYKLTNRKQVLFDKYKESLNEIIAGSDEIRIEKRYDFTPLDFGDPLVDGEMHTGNPEFTEYQARMIENPKQENKVRYRNFIVSCVSEYDAGACSFDDLTNRLAGHFTGDNSSFDKKDVVAMAKSLGMECREKSNSFTHSAGRSNY